MENNIIKKEIDNSTSKFKHPKELYALNFHFHTESEHSFIELANENEEQFAVKYLSEQSVKEMLAEKDKEIERLKSEVKKLNKVEIFRYEHGFESCSIIYLINGEIYLYSIPMYGGEEREEHIDFIDLEDLIEKIKKFT